MQQARRASCMALLEAKSVAVLQTTETNKRERERMVAAYVALGSVLQVRFGSHFGSRFGSCSG